MHIHKTENTEAHSGKAIGTNVHSSGSGSFPAVYFETTLPTHQMG